jgi:hypothetical protein
MGTNRLLACPSCGRHVRLSELACPFCEAPLPLSFANTILPRASGLRSSRGALFALGATSLALAAGCSHPDALATSDAGIVTTVAASRDGAVSNRSDAGQAEDDADDNDEAAIAVYGGPPPHQEK